MIALAARCPLTNRTDLSPLTAILWWFLRLPNHPDVCSLATEIVWLLLLLSSYRRIIAHIIKSPAARCLPLAHLHLLSKVLSALKANYPLKRPDTSANRTISIANDICSTVFRARAAQMTCPVFGRHISITTIHKISYRKCLNSYDDRVAWTNANICRSHWPTIDVSNRSNPFPALFSFPRRKCMFSVLRTAIRPPPRWSCRRFERFPCRREI